jgi:hypothetical protein
MTRSPKIRRSAAILIGLLALLVFAAPASAGRTWCARDPIVRIQGVELQIWVAVPQEYVPYVNGPIKVNIQTPTWAEGELVFADAGFNGHGEVVTFSDMPGNNTASETNTQAKVTVSVPIAYDQLPPNTQVQVQVEVIPEYGKARTVGGNARGTSVGVVLSSAS